MRGLKINKASRKLDVVLVAARYDDEGALEFAKGYERRGFVWSDVRIFDRDTLIQKVRSGADIFTGDPERIPGNYEPAQRVKVASRGGNDRLIVNGGAENKDDLGLPVI